MTETAETANRKEKFTPGPWEVGYGELDGGYLGIWKAGTPDVLSRISPAGSVTCEDKANAALIAAAPDMYAALVKAVADYGKPGGPWNVPSEPGTWIHSATSALAKARGES